MHQLKISKDLTVSAARQALLDAGGLIEDGCIECPSSEAALAGLEYLAALHRQRQDEAELADSRRFVTRHLDSLVVKH